MKYFPESPKGDYGGKKEPIYAIHQMKENVQNEDGGINMCGAVDQMIAEGMERGLAQGMERGLAQGTERGIKNLIEVCQELGTSYDNVQFQVEMKYNLSQEEAERYMKQYWK